MKKSSIVPYLVAIALAISFGLVAAFCLARSLGYLSAHLHFDRNITLVKPTSKIPNLAPLVASTTTKLIPVMKGPVYISEYRAEIADDKRQIVADLGKMKLYFYDNGQVLDEINIVSKGRPGTPWETPSGLYQVQTKETSHFSSMGHVYMPYSMQFWGNYFIHGWPYYPGGEPVGAGFSGGCIRLTTPDSKKVFQFAQKGTEIYVLNSTTTAEQTLPGHYSTLSSDLPPISASAYLIADIDTGEVILEKNKNEEFSIASLTKLMTALVSLDFINLFSNVNLTASALAAWGTAGELKVGESLPAKDLLYPLLLESSNDAGEALAESSGRELFIKRMNDRAVAIGLTNTNYNDPTGLSDRNTSTVSDLFLLARHIYVNKRFVFDITKADGYKFGSHNWLNINPFHLMAGFIGGKSGETNNARQAYVNIFNQTLAYGEKRNIAIILLHSEDRDGDTKKFINYLTNNVEFK